VAAGLNPLTYDAEGDADGDGVSNQQEITNGTSPTDYYNGQPSVVTSLVPSDGTLIDGNHIAVKLTTSGGVPLVNAPVVFTASSADHGLSPTWENRWTNARRRLDARTDGDGVARAYVVRTDELIQPLLP
jgi:hypothetical protein